MASDRPKLRFGLWYAFRNPAQWQTTYENLYAEVLDQIAWAETIGYDDVWLTEHHFTDDGHAPSPLLQAAAIAGIPTVQMLLFPSFLNSLRYQSTA